MTDYAVLVPTKGRPGPMARMFKKCPVLNRPSTFVGLEPTERALYARWRRDYPNPTLVDVTNPWGVPSAAREALQ